MPIFQFMPHSKIIHVRKFRKCNKVHAKQRGSSQLRWELAHRSRAHRGAIGEPQGLALRRLDRLELLYQPLVLTLERDELRELPTVHLRFAGWRGSGWQRVGERKKPLAISILQTVKNVTVSPQMKP